MNTKSIVMSRVRAIHTLRPFVNGTAFAAVLAVVALSGIGKEVWVARIIQNMPVTDVSAFAHFVATAFFQTTFMVQALTLGTVGALAYIARETARFLATSSISVGKVSP